MQHSKQNKTLSRNRSQRTALLSGLAVSLIRDEKIVTTTAKAKALRPAVERLITLAKNDTVAARRLAAQRLQNPNSATITKLFGTIAPRYAERAGGYTRIVKLDRTEGRDQSVIELV